MSDFNYRARIPTDTEYDQLMDITESDAISHWSSILSWTDNEEL